MVPGAVARDGKRLRSSNGWSRIRLHELGVPGRKANGDVLKLPPPQGEVVTVANVPGWQNAHTGRRESSMRTYTVVSWFVAVAIFLCALTLSGSWIEALGWAAAFAGIFCPLARDRTGRAS